MLVAAAAAGAAARGGGRPLPGLWPSVVGAAAKGVAVSSRSRSPNKSKAQPSRPPHPPRTRRRPRPATPDDDANAAAPEPIVDVLYEDKHLILVNKPPGVLSQAAAATDESDDLLSRVKAHLAAAAAEAAPHAKTKTPYVGLVHRLDRNVSGAVVLAKRSKAAARLGAEFKGHRVRKVYVAVVAGAVDGDGKGKEEQEQVVLSHALAFEGTQQGQGQGKGKGKGGNLTRVLGEAPPPPRQDGAAAAASTGDNNDGSPTIGILRYRPLLRLAPNPNKPQQPQTLLAVELVTGRKHQIRAQLAHVGLPVVGDVKYGAPVALRDRSLALHCRVLGFRHPKRGGEGDEDDGEGEKGRTITCLAPLPASWRLRFGEAVVAAVERVDG